MPKPNPKPTLTPPDIQQCQAEKPNGNTFLTFGGTVGRVRCQNKPIFIVRETVAADDGLCGAMSLCADCLAVLSKQVGLANVAVEKIP